MPNISPFTNLRLHMGECQIAHAPVVFVSFSKKISNTLFL